MSYMHTPPAPPSPPASAPDCSSSSPPQNTGNDCDGQHQAALISADVQTDHGLQIDVNALGQHVADITIDLGGVDGLLSHAGATDGLLPDLGDGLLCGLLG